MNTLYLNLKADNIDALLWRTHYIGPRYFVNSGWALQLFQMEKICDVSNADNESKAGPHIEIKLKQQDKLNN